MVTMISKYSNLSLLLDPTSGIPSDVTFKIVGDGDEVLGEVKGHKVLLAAFSPVFKNMFFGPLKETNDVIQVKQTTFEAFEKMIEYIYKSDSDWSGMTVLELYDIINLAERYNMTLMTNEIKTQMETMPLTLESLMDVAHTAAQFTQFEEVSTALLSSCAKFLQKAISGAEDQLQFAVEQVGTGRETTVLHLFGLIKNLPPLECSNCRKAQCLDGELVVSREKFCIGLKIKVNKACSYWGVNGGNYGNKHFTVDSISMGFPQQQCTLKERDVAGNSSWHLEYNGVPTFCYECV